LLITHLGEYSLNRYEHGGNIKAFSEKIGCKIDEVIDLSSNINFIKPKIDIDFNNLNISAYPNYDELQSAIANLYGVKSSQLELFNGATIAIHSLFRLLNLKHCTLYAPLYLEYKKSAKSYGYEIELVNRWDNIYKEIKPKSLVIFVNPSTPDGKFYDLDRLIQQWIAKGCSILIDESFLDFTPYTSAIKYLKEYNKLYILKSMTKFYSSAGIRIGAVISTQTNIEAIKSQEPLWKISEFDSQYLQSALRDNSFSKKAKEINNKNRTELVNILKKSPYIEKVYDSTANFILVKLKNIDAKAFQKKLISSKIMIRDCSNFDFLDNRFIRIAVKSSFFNNLLTQSISMR